MDYFEESDHAFIIRIWKENREIQDASPTWRGVIEHVPTGKRRYLRNLGHIIAFLSPYFNEMGLRMGVFWRLVVWASKFRDSNRRPSTQTTSKSELDAGG